MMRALDGITVLDLTQGWAGPGGAMYLAEQGANVIKVEPPQGDFSRRIFLDPPIGGEDRSYMAMNRSKRGIVLNLKEKEAGDILHRLIQQADVLMHNYRKGVPERLQIHFEKAKELNPKLIYLTLTPFGKKGPYANQPAFDLVIQALAGALHRRFPDGSPMGTGIWVSDCSTAIMVAYAISLALFVRERTGIAQHVDMALFNQTLLMQLPDLVRKEEELDEEKKEALSLMDFYSPYRCEDGKYIMQVALTEEQWKGLCSALEREDLFTDPRFDTPLKRSQNGASLSEELAKTFVKKPRDAWVGPLVKADVPHAPVLSRDEVFRHPQAVENEMIVDVAHPVAGPLKMLGIPFRLNETPGSIAGPPPLLGEHTRELLLELGYSEAEIEAWRKKGVIGVR